MNELAVVRGPNRSRPDHIGRYVVERFLARGGMAEVFLAKAVGPGGFAKRVVVKRIHPDLSQEPRFVEMFLDEAKLAALLSHPNIVQVFDFGLQDDTYFIAMEHIPGESLRAILRARQAMGKHVPPRVVAAIAASVCEGLHYAHQLVDEDGRAAQIVHRDVTPENILVSNIGMPKLVDFGIAKAKSQGIRTECGVIKGKCAYLAPEQIRGEPLSHLIDVYALGVTLYEVLGGQRPYQAENELALVHEVIAARAVPLHVLNPAVPEQLSKVVATAMCADPQRRYPDARALQAALYDFLRASGPRVTADEIAALVREVSLHRRLAETGPKAIAPAQPTPPPRDAVLPEVSDLDLELSQAFTDPAELPEPPREPEAPASASAPAPRGHGHGALVAGCVLAAAALALAGTASSRGIQTTPQAPRATALAVSASAAPPGALATPAAEADAASGSGSLSVSAEKPCEIFLDGRHAGQTPFRAELAVGKHDLAIRGPGGVQRRWPLEIEKGVELAKAIHFGHGTLEVRVMPWGKVSIDGEDFGETPLAPLSLVEGDHDVVISNPELGKTEEHQVRIEPGARELVKVLW